MRHLILQKTKPKEGCVALSILFGTRLINKSNSKAISLNKHPIAYNKIVMLRHVSHGSFFQGA